MVWGNIEEIKKHTTLFTRSSQFFFSNKVLGPFFILKEILPEQNFLID